MEDPRYRKEPRPAELNQRRKPLRKEYSIVLRSALVVLVLMLVALGWMLQQARQPMTVQKSPEPFIPPEIITRLAGTRVETAQAKLEQERPGEALALLASALTANPAAEDARALAERILQETRWHLPVLTIHHPLPVEQLVFRDPANLWVGLAGETNTVVKWNPADVRIGSVLFPVRSDGIRSLVVDHTGKRMIVERAGFMLLCDAETLKPVMDLGVLPDFLTPVSVVVFSSDGLLLGHPAVAAEGEGLVWQIRDAVSGQILRSHEVPENGGSEMPRPLTAFLDRTALRVVHADGGLLEIPVSPVEPPKHIAAAEPQALLHAQFLADGSAWLGLVDRGPHEPKQLSLLPAGETNDVASVLAAMSDRFPWSRQPGIWNGLLRDYPISPLRVKSHAVIAPDGLHAPIRTEAKVTAVARHGRMVIVGGADGLLTGYHLLPKPEKFSAENNHTETPDDAAAAAFLHLTTALCGLRHNEDERRFTDVPVTERQQAAADCDLEQLRRLFPSLDFHAVLDDLRSTEVHEASPDDMRPLSARLARAAPEGEGSPAVEALALALESSLPGTIAECLAAADNAPPLLRKLAESRIAWLEGRKGDALAGWPDEFPDLQKIRLREDWDGWEQTDFRPALDAFRQLMESELALLELPAESTPEQRKELFKRLTDPETARIFGRLRVGRAALQAAQTFAAFENEAESTLALAVLAGNFGAQPAEAIRSEANALASLGRHDQAHQRWISLITEQPLESHHSSDYAEAAYTAFETSEPQQAMELLITGIQRFPNDSEFALRAGWIALLTAHPEHAYRFLLSGRQAGFPPSTHERAAALLAIAAAQCGEAFEAGEFFQELIRLNPAWEDPAAIENLDWPEELKATLRQLTW